ncbi:MAG: hypothetical protein IKM75_06575 [Bacteroidales bacterium]|nr:hypothetical protein [Bacteroidales bacterium]
MKRTNKSKVIIIPQPPKFEDENPQGTTPAASQANPTAPKDSVQQASPMTDAAKDKA